MKKNDKSVVNNSKLCFDNGERLQLEKHLKYLLIVFIKAVSSYNDSGDQNDFGH